MILRFVVPGPPVAKARARVYMTKTGAIGSSNPAKTAAYEKHVGLCAMAARSKVRGWDPTRTRYEVHLLIFRGSKIGDLDNFFKAIADGMEGIVFHNDKNVMKLSAEMLDEDPIPRAEVEVRYDENE